MCVCVIEFKNKCVPVTLPVFVFVYVCMVCVCVINYNGYRFNKRQQMILVGVIYSWYRACGTFVLIADAGTTNKMDSCSPGKHINFDILVIKVRQAGITYRNEVNVLKSSTKKKLHTLGYYHY